MHCFVFSIYYANIFCVTDLIRNQTGFSSVRRAEFWVGEDGFFFFFCYAWHLMAFLLMQLKEDLKRQKEAACFKARPNVVVHQEPFVPKKDNKPVSGRVTVLATRAWLITQN